jgi:hypothetical protein
MTEAFEHHVWPMLWLNGELLNTRYKQITNYNDYNDYNEGYAGLT